MFISLQANLFTTTIVMVIIVLCLCHVSVFQNIEGGLVIYPMARAVTAQATTDVAPADAKLSLLHALM